LSMVGTGVAIGVHRCGHKRAEVRAPWGAAFIGVPH